MFVIGANEETQGNESAIQAAKMIEKPKLILPTLILLEMPRLPFCHGEFVLHTMDCLSLPMDSAKTKVAEPFRNRPATNNNTAGKSRTLVTT